MNTIAKTFRHILRHFLLICLYLYANTSLAEEYTAESDTKSLYVVTTIKPLYAIASSIAKGVLDIHLLNENTPFSHHMQMKPSAHQMLHRADILFWIGPELESFILPTLATTKQLKYKEPFINNTSLILLSEKVKSLHKTTTSSAKTIKVVDPHIWLSTHNAMIIAEQMKHILIMMDPTHEAIYEQNYENFSTRINLLDNEIEVKLNNLHNSFFIVYHDAFSYFSSRYNLSSLGSLLGPNDETIRASQLKRLHKLMKEQHIKCLFYTAEASKNYIHKFNRQYHNLRTVEVDPIGTFIPTTANAYEELMRNISDKFAECLETN